MLGIIFLVGFSSCQSDDFVKEAEWHVSWFGVPGQSMGKSIVVSGQVDSLPGLFQAQWTDYRPVEISISHESHDLNAPALATDGQFSFSLSETAFMFDLKDGVEAEISFANSTGTEISITTTLDQGPEDRSGLGP